VDVLGFDACDMSRVETLQVLSGLAKFLIGSQIGVPFSGWPYHTILDKLRISPAMTEDELARLILNEYYDSYRPPRVTLTMLDGGQQRQYEELQGAVGGLKGLVDSFLNVSPEITDILRDTFTEARRDVADPLLDLRDFCVALRTNLSMSLTVPEATKQAVVSAVDGVIALHDSLVKAHERRGPMVTGLNGIGISPYTITKGWSAQQLSIYDRVGWRRPPAAAQPAPQPAGQAAQQSGATS
jgi:hypothetical protein